MSDLEQKKEVVKKYGRSSSWADKVDKMSEEQVTAIYLRLKAEGKL
jgi:hypothetical protein